jgi:uncharacterized protein YggU (UPF0235/DUF167 family)
LSVAVKPGSHRAAIARRDGGIVVAVRERAIDGRANAAVIAAVAAWLDIAPSRITLERGASGRSKRLAVAGLDEATLAAALDRL